MSPTLVASACGRAALAGHPSDGYGGAVVGVPIPHLRAEVELASGAGFVTVGERRLGRDLRTTMAEVRAADLEGGDALVWAAVETLVSWADRTGAGLDPSPFGLRWSTDIPRSVGLAGSTAIVVATLRVLAAHWKLEVPAPTVADLALRAERDQLGIAAGMQDRLLVALEHALSMDFEEGAAHRVLSAGCEWRFTVGWRTDGASDSGELHADLKQRVEHDVALREAMAGLGALAERGAAAFESGDAHALGEAMVATMALRRELGIVDDVTAALAETATSIGAPAVTTGSGGAVIAIDPDGGAAGALAAAGASATALVVPSAAPR